MKFEIIFLFFINSAVLCPVACPWGFLGMSGSTRICAPAPAPAPPPPPPTNVPRSVFGPFQYRTKDVFQQEEEEGMQYDFDAYAEEDAFDLDLDDE